MCPGKHFHYIFTSVHTSIHFYSPPNRFLPIVKWPPTPFWNRLASSSASFVFRPSLVGHSCFVQFYGEPSHSGTVCVCWIGGREKEGYVSIISPSCLPPTTGPFPGHRCLTHLEAICLSLFSEKLRWRWPHRFLVHFKMQYLGMTCISIAGLDLFPETGKTGRHISHLYTHKLACVCARARMQNVV